MPAPPAPFKTALGLEELQSRSRRLGQRYRTVLLLVDGRRPLGEVLAMALSAGADTSHFEELVKLGLVEVPAQSMAPEPRDSGPIPLDVPTLTSVAYDVLEIPVLTDVPPAAANPVLPPSPITVTALDDDLPPAHVDPIRITTAPEPEPAPPRRKRSSAERPQRVEPVLLRELPPVPMPETESDTGPDTVANPEVAQLAEPTPAVADVAAAPAPAPAAPRVLAVVPAPAPAPAPPTRRSAPPPSPKVSRQRSVPAPAPAAVLAVVESPRGGPPLMTEAVQSPSKRAKKARVTETTETAFEVADHARPRKATTDDKLLQDVRSLLIGAMGAEAALFSPMTLSRLRNAQTHKALIALVWEIERQRSHVNRSRAQMFSLERARDLLGMGNTVVAGDSQADTMWPDTQGNND